MEALSGWLVVNRFLNTGKFTDLSARFEAAAEKFGVKLRLLTNDELLPCMGAPEYEDPARFDILPAERPDFVLFYDKDVRLAEQLERRGLRLFNNARAIELCDDKSLMHLCLDSAVPMPRTYCAPFTYENIGYNDTLFLEKLFGTLGSPLVIKEVFGSFGQQVYLASTPEDAAEILKKVGGKRLIFQEFIKESFGRDLRLNVVGNRVIAAMYRYNEHGDFRANISNGGSMKPHTPSAAEEALALKAAELMGLDFCGVDLLFGRDGEPILCEVNSNAHFKSIYDCTGVNAADEIMAHIVRCVG
ncbi:MAG: RimK family alpha-L-glutamate ligase [Clostridia bacterium]|nr:RimK family alpha-L-glutamate ligase [Clostridia bacterium]